MNKRKINWKYEIGDKIIKKGSDGNSCCDLIITDREIRIKQRKGKSGAYLYRERYYQYKCNICGAEDLWRREIDMVNECQCACCAMRVRIRGINTIGDLYPELIGYFVDDDAFDPKYTRDSRYDVKCPVCGHRKNMRIAHLLDQRFYCDYCQSIFAKRNDLVGFFASEDAAKKISYGSAKKLLMRCPDCGREKMVPAVQLYRDGFHCDRCGDTISYPERFMCSVLSEAGIQYETQVTRNVLSWCDKFRYDFYIPSQSMIIETNGEQHYNESFKYCGGKSLLEVQQNDSLKKEKALMNGIKHYVCINCMYSNPDWIRKEIECSLLAELIDLKNVDWLRCAKTAMKSVAKTICLYWKEHEMECSTSDLARLFNLSNDCIVKYLKCGTEIGWCHYDAEKELRKANAATKKTCSKPVMVMKHGTTLGEFESVAELVRQSFDLFGEQFASAGISGACRGKYSHHHGYVFKYI